MSLRCLGAANRTPAARPGASMPIAARFAARPRAWLHVGSPVESTCPAYSGSANSSARATSARSGARRSCAIGSSAAAALSGCSDTTLRFPDLMRVFYGFMGWLTDWKRRRVLAKHRMEDSLWEKATRGLTFLPQDERLKALVLLFLAEKEFTSAHAFPLTDEIRVAIAAQACLPILELGLDWYQGWHGVVVYPGDFRVQRTETDEHGVVHEWDDELAGEAMPGGPVVISWDAAANDPAMNVVIHEFAHKLDMVNGAADGMPPLHAGMDRRAWHRVFSEAYE